MQVIYGLNPVLEGLRSGTGVITTIFLSSGGQAPRAEEIARLARERGIPVTYREGVFMDRLAGGNRHQGVVALSGDFAYHSLDSIIQNGDTDFSGGPLLVLDSITDPQNLGSLIRSAHCFGIRAVIIPKDRAAGVTPVVIKASAGSVLHTPICRVVNIARTIEQLKRAGYWIFGADASAENDCRKLTYEPPSALVLGSEGTGLRSLVRRKCDYLIRIPMAGVVDSLNVAVAGGILLYEMTRAAWKKPSETGSARKS